MNTGKEVELLPQSGFVAGHLHAAFDFLGVRCEIRVFRHFIVDLND